MFQAGIDGLPGERIQVYAEVRNFTSRPYNGEYETKLSCLLEIREGEKVTRTINLDTCIDRSQTPRHDYFLNFQFPVPARLKPGWYTLWITVRDVTGGEASAARIARKSVDFKVCAPAANQ
jgi:hypothetical protein